MTLADTYAPAASAIPLQEVTNAELSIYAKLIYERTGIQISHRKQTLLSNRLRRRLRHTGISSFLEYYQHLRNLPANHPEWDAFLQEITTHETFLFRDKSQWDWFQTVFIPECAAAARINTAKRSLRIWSAASSTGDEAYTAACCIAARLPNYKQWNISILGTDIGLGALEQAKKGVFCERAMRLVPPDYQRCYFNAMPDSQTWQAKSALSEMISFRQHNLMERLLEKPFDLVFLKNVLIYFDAASKKSTLDNILHLVRPGGLLMVGASDGICDLLNHCERIQSWLYRKPHK